MLVFYCSSLEFHFTLALCVGVYKWIKWTEIENNENEGKIICLDAWMEMKQKSYLGLNENEYFYYNIKF